MSLLELRHLTKHYRGKNGRTVQAVRDVSLSVEPGDVPAVVSQRFDRVAAIYGGRVVGATASGLVSHPCHHRGTDAHDPRL
jgi:hypothetical protein